MKLLVWTSKQRVGSLEIPVIPTGLLQIFKQIGIDGKMWSELVWNFKKYFGRSSAVGSPDSLNESAAQRNRKFAHGQNAVSGCFATG